jgi:hypothetical protein
MYLKILAYLVIMLQKQPTPSSCAASEFLCLQLLASSWQRWTNGVLLTADVL